LTSAPDEEESSFSSDDGKHSVRMLVQLTESHDRIQEQIAAEGIERFGTVELSGSQPIGGRL